MESTRLNEALAALRAGFEKPPSHMEIVRDAVLSKAARAKEVEMPPLLNDEQRQVFVGKIDLVSAFLETEDGADAIELLINTFSKFVADREEAAAAAAAAANPPADGGAEGNPGY